MNKLEKLIVPYSVPNVVLVHKRTGKKKILYAVSSNGDTVLIGPIEKGTNEEWINRCMSIPKRELIESYDLG
ncbi:hypothetical protein ABH897_002325 [Paenibacillus sp. RC73]|uniref:hypothetical protein n=1 Tax=Paenibacillus sp. RC73 TaxID=3156250 RepID=UPI0038396072